MNSNFRILIVSLDEMLLRTRELILGGFFFVEGAGRISEARSLIENHAFNLIVLCHSLTDDECAELAQLAKSRNPSIRILALSPQGSDFKPWASKQIGVDRGPYALLNECAALLGVRLKSKARQASLKGASTLTPD
jgi:DNA-binding response OmpR family regulator